MDCLDRSLSETESPPPFQHLVTEQAKSFLALQELQNEVGALLEFRDLVIESFPHLRVKMATPTPTPSHSSSLLGSGSKWEPGVRVRRKLSSAPGEMAPSLLPRSRSNSHGKGPKSGETSAGSSAVQDSGFCAESKEHSAASSGSSAGGGGAGGGRGSKNREVEDELMNLLDMIQAKGTALRLEVDYLQSQLCSGPEGLDLTESAVHLPPRRKCRSLDMFPAMLSDSSTAGANTSPCGRPRDELFGLKKERDELARRVKTLELDSAHNLALTNSLLAEVGALSAEKRYLADRLANHPAPASSSHSSPAPAHCFTPLKSYEMDDEGRQMSSTNPYTETHGRGGVNLFPCTPPTPSRPSDPVPRKLNALDGSLCTPGPRLGALDGIVSTPREHMRSPRGVKLSRYKEKMAAILKEKSPLELQRHLLTTVFHNEVRKTAIVSTDGTFHQAHNTLMSIQLLILTYQVDTVTKSRVELVCQLAKIKEENEDLKFQLEEKSIELEGTRARVRLYERLQAVKLSSGGDVHTLLPPNPILPQLNLPCSEPLSSSTESAHHGSPSSSLDKLTRSPSKRRSKIPLPKTPVETSPLGNGVPSNGVPSNRNSSSIPKYQKDSSWHSNASRKSADSLIRNWEPSSKPSGQVKKPAILSSKELSLAARRESLHHPPMLGKSHPGDAFTRRLRKSSSESSTNSSGASVSPVMRKPRPGGGPDAKLKPPNPLRKLNRPHRSRSLEKSSIITLPAVDEVNESPDSLEANPEPLARTASQELNAKTTKGNARNNEVLNSASRELDQEVTKNTVLNNTSQELTSRINKVNTPLSLSRFSSNQLDFTATKDTFLSPGTENIPVTNQVSSSDNATLRTNVQSPQCPFKTMKTESPAQTQESHKTTQDNILSQTLVKDLRNNNETYVVKSSDVRQGIPEFSSNQDKTNINSLNKTEVVRAESQACVTSSKSHTYRVRRKPNRFVDKERRDNCELEQQSQSEQPCGTPSSQTSNGMSNHYRVKRSKRIRPNQNHETPASTQKPNVHSAQNGQTLSSCPEPIVHPILNGATARPVKHLIQNGHTQTSETSVVHLIQNGQTKPIVHLIQSSRHLALTPLTSNTEVVRPLTSVEMVRNSMEYFDSIETVTSSGSVLHSAAGSSMNSNRLRRESLAECDSLDQSHPDISDSEDLV